MPILPKLIGLYEDSGFTVSTGLMPSFVGGLDEAPFTWLIKDGKKYTNGLGIAMQEVYFLECLSEALTPRNIFIIGNSFGWSTFALALANPQAKVVAIDSGYDVQSIEGLDLTSGIAHKAGLNVEAVKGASPDDIPRIVADSMDGTVDFAFIDGLHTNEQIVIDFKVLRQHTSENCVFLFHDIISCEMEQGFAEIRSLWDGEDRLLLGTSSGMGILFPKNIDERLRQTIDAFTGSEEAIAAMNHELWKRKNKRKIKFQRSLDKRKSALKKLFGKGG
ncbi:MAG: class I SAM-dependent methyltransferase [Rhodospirillales bacterium]|nr:class I SAM-dependent methyltransferase [Rhodospirillales bacterium]MCW9040889.1 class I SAM-dependent methyltransferase [Rhodospirillales bacterium]